MQECPMVITMCVPMVSMGVLQCEINRHYLIIGS